MSYLKEVRNSRELLLNLTMREVRGQYKRTVFGQLWSLANPIAQMIIYTFVFGFVLKAKPEPGNPSGINIFALWLMSGLIPWSFFANVVSNSMGSLIANEGLIQKVYFPRIVLPLSTVGSAAYNWLFEMAVLLAALVLAGSFIWPWVPLLFFTMILLAVFASGIGMALSIANVHFRDTQYLVGILLNFWMFLTPIMYPLSLIASQSERIGPLIGNHVTLLGIYRSNPMERFVEVFRNLIYDNRMPELSNLIFILIAALLSFAVGSWIFAKNERGLAEAL